MIIVLEHAIFKQRMDTSQSDGTQIDACKPIFVTPILHNDMDTKDFLDNRKWCLLASTYLSTALVQVVGVCCLHKTEKPRKKIYATAIGNVLNGLSYAFGIGIKPWTRFKSFVLSTGQFGLAMDTISFTLLE